MSNYIISEATKIIDLIDKYPFLEELLAELDPILKRFQNPILRKTVGRKATMTDVANLIHQDL